MDAESRIFASVMTWSYLMRDAMARVSRDEPVGSHSVTGRIASASFSLNTEFQTIVFDSSFNSCSEHFRSEKYDIGWSYMAGLGVSRMNSTDSLKSGRSCW